MWADSWARKHGNTVALRKAKWGVRVVIKSELSCPGVTAGGAPDMFNTDDWLHGDDPIADWKARYYCSHDPRLSRTLLLGCGTARRSSNTQIKKKNRHGGQRLGFWTNAGLIWMPVNVRHYTAVCIASKVHCWYCLVHQAEPDPSVCGCSSSVYISFSVLRCSLLIWMCSLW